MNETRGYLIERYINGGLHFWNGKYVDDRGFTPEVNDATKFVFFGDGSTVLSWLLGGHGRVCEHLWIGSVGDQRIVLHGGADAPSAPTGEKP